jgi:MFS family permease
MDKTQKIWNKRFILLTLANFLMCITYYAVISTLPIYLVSDLHAGEKEVGLVLASYIVASIMVRPFGGYILDRFGRRTVYIISLLLYSVLFGGYLVATSIPVIIVLRFLQGLTWGITTIAGSTIAVDIIPEEKRGEGIGYFALSTTLGMSTGPVIGLFLSHQFGYLAMFIASVLVSLVSVACAGSIKLRIIKPVVVPLSIKNLFEPSTILPSFNLFVTMITYGGLLSFIALYGKEIGIYNTSYFFLVFSIGIATSRLAAGKSFDRKGPGTILTICLSLMVVGFPILVLLKNEIGFYLAAIIIGFGIGVVFPVFQAMVNNLVTPARRGAGNSTLYTFLDLGMGSGMVVMGYIADYVSISATFIVSSAIALISLTIFRAKTLEFYNRKKVKY